MRRYIGIVGQPQFLGVARDGTTFREPLEP